MQEKWEERKSIHRVDGCQRWCAGSRESACHASCCGGLCRSTARPSQLSLWLSLCSSWPCPWTPLQASISCPYASFFLSLLSLFTHTNKQTQTQLNVMVQSLIAISTKEFYQYRKYPTQYEYQLVRDVIVTQCGWVEEEGFRLECQVWISESKLDYKNWLEHTHELENQVSQRLHF